MKSALKNILHSSDDFGFVKVWRTLKVKALKKKTVALTVAIGL